MAVKHAATKSDGDVLNAAEWNADHLIDPLVVTGLLEVQAGNPTILSTFTDATYFLNLYAIDIVGNYLYLCSQMNDYFIVIDISNPASMHIEGKITDAQLDGPVDVFVRGTYAYVVCNPGNRVTIVDISNPALPSITGSVQDGTNLYHPQGIDVVGKYAYVSCYGCNRLTIVDISNPAAPSVTGTVQDGTKLNEAVQVRVLGDYAFVSCATGDRITSVDVSNKAAPAVLDTLTDAKLDWAEGLQIDKAHRIAYVAVYTNKFTVVDINDPKNMAIISSITDNTNLVTAGRLFLDELNKRAYVSCCGSTGPITVVDINNPRDPKIAATIFSSYLDGAGNPVVKGEYLFSAPYGPAPPYQGRVVALTLKGHLFFE